MRLRILSIVVCVLFNIYQPCFSSSALIANFGQITENIFRGARVDDKQAYADLSKLGIQAVINLEYFHEDDLELCQSYGLDCQHHPLKLLPLPYADESFPYDKLKKIFHHVINESNLGKKIYIHCYFGSDRTGALAALITIREKTCSKEYIPHNLWSEIESDLNKHGFHENLYPSLKKEIKSWVFERPEWICNE